MLAREPAALAKFRAYDRDEERAADHYAVELLSRLPGDGTGCRTGRQKGLNLGGTSYVDYEVPPGKATFTLHMGDDYDCKKPAVYTISVDATADTASMVHVYTPDAKTITHVVLPLEL